MNIRDELAKKLLEIDAVTIRNTENLFTWASGIKAPIYCDNRLIMSYPKVRDMVAEVLKDIILENYPEVEVLVGTATAGIPHAAWTAQKMDLPMAYVRSAAKGHGKENQIEGKIVPGQKVVIIEDLLSTGGSSIRVANVLRDAGATVLGIAAIFSYGFKTMEEELGKLGLSYYTISDYSSLLKIARDTGRITDEEEKVLSEWNQNPYIFTEK
jgi:orotate phosphoribosyltransferase